MFALEERVLQILQADATLAAIEANLKFSPSEIWLVPLGASFPRISFATGTSGGGGPAGLTTSRKITLDVWCESKTSRKNAQKLAERVEQLLHRQESALSGTTASGGKCGVTLCKLTGSPIALREPATKANQVKLSFEVIAQSYSLPGN
jgi:hypothetical protein